MHLIKKIIYCKCPNCNKHGIIIWSKLKNKGDLTVVCKECEKVFRRKLLLSWLLELVSLMIFLALFWMLKKVGIDIPLILVLLTLVLFLCITAHFLPLEDVSHFGNQ